MLSETEQRLDGSPQHNQQHNHNEQPETAVQQDKMTNDLESNLISILSHEFRTPLAVIMSTVSYMRLKVQKGREISTNELMDRLRVIEEQTKCMNEMLSEMTLLNQDEILGHILKPTLVDITQFFSEIVHDINAVYPQHTPAKIVTDCTCEELSLDSYLMRQIFINLLCNAMKYSSPDKPVICEYVCENNVLRTTVTDQGIGIPPEDQPHLFNAFYRARNVGAVAGTGLGMWLVKRAVDLMGGTIRFESTLGEGTSFYVTLPIGAA